MICIIAAFVLRLVNLKKDQRGKQFLLPCISPVLLILIGVIVWKKTQVLSYAGSGFFGAEHLIRNLFVFVA